METCYNVRITTDDLITLRACHDRLQSDLFIAKDIYRTSAETRDRQRILETLSSILTQCAHTKTPAHAHSPSTPSAS